MGLIITVSGVSGSGKTTIFEHLLKKGLPYQLIPSVTSRLPRDRDLLGEFIYLSEAEFQQKNVRGEFLGKSVTLHGTCYGTLRASIDDALRTRGIWVMVVDPLYLNILTEYAGEEKVLGLHILSPGETILRERLEKRGGTPADIEERIRDCKGWDITALELGTSLPIQYLTNKRSIASFLADADECLTRYLNTR